MKRTIVAYSLAILAVLNLAFRVQAAQSAETIWLSANSTAYKSGDTVLVTLNATSATPVQGFTFQIRYDPACLRPVSASSPISGMNGLPLPQLTGLVDGSYASTTPQLVNGVLAEVRFTSLQGCQTGVYLESAALAVRNPEGFAAPLANVFIGERNVSLIVDRESAESQALPPETGSILPLAPPESESGFLIWIFGAGLIAFVGLGLFGIYKVMKSDTSKKAKPVRPSSRLSLHINEGPQRGKKFPLNKLPCLIGRDPQSDICINDPNVYNKHAKIYAGRSGYYLMDLGGGTFVNGHRIINNSVVLYPGDVVGLGKGWSFVFG